MKLRLKIFDVIIVLIVTSLTFLAAYMAYMKPQGKSQVVIRGEGREWVYPIEAEATVAVNGPLGCTTVRIHGNSAWVESSPCDNHTCIAVGAIHNQGDWVACLPNNVLVIVHGIDDEVDGISW